MAEYSAELFGQSKIQSNTRLSTGMHKVWQIKTYNIWCEFIATLTFLGNDRGAAAAPSEMEALERQLHLIFQG